MTIATQVVNSRYPSLVGEDDLAVLLRVLLIEDDEVDAELIVRTLERHGYRVHMQRVVNEDQLLDCLERQRWDVVLADYHLPGFDALRALDVVQRLRGALLPFIIVSGAIGEDTAVRAMRAGAHDYVLKDNLGRLAVAVARELRAAKERAQSRELEKRLMHADRLAAIGQLAAGVAHEINNPLAFIIGNVEILGEHVETMRTLIRSCERLAALGAGDELAPVAAEIRDIISSGDLEHALYDMHEIRMASMSGAERIAAIVRDLRTFARIEDDDIEMVQINEVVNIACNMVENTIRHKAILQRNLGEIPRFAADRNKLIQTVVNLLVNAAQAIEDGEIGENAVRVVTRRDGDTMVLEVSDTGSGIPEVIRKQIFEPFFTTKSRDEGTGLGLALCADIVRKHRGTIAVTSELGEGTCFTIRIPLETELAPRR
ncbi:MAG: ATP-binding protein, partial [Myxococcota bacterium]